MNNGHGYTRVNIIGHPRLKALPFSRIMLWDKWRAVYSGPRSYDSPASARPFWPAETMAGQGWKNGRRLHKNGSEAEHGFEFLGAVPLRRGWPQPISQDSDLSEWLPG